MLDKDIKRVLKETKEKKENLLISEEIVKTRLSMIIESNDIKNFNKFSESKKVKIGFSILSELSYLKETELLNEIDLWNSLKGILGSVLTSAPEAVIFEPLFNSILAGIGIPEGIFRNTLVSFLATNPGRLLDAMKDCKEMTKLISESIIEGLIMQLQKTKGFSGIGYDIIRDSLGNAIRNSDFGGKLEDGLAGTICGLFDKYTNNAKEVAGKLTPTTSTTTS
jgi:hypothetical protein